MLERFRCRELGVSSVERDVSSDLLQHPVKERSRLRGGVGDFVYRDERFQRKVIVTVPVIV